MDDALTPSSRKALEAAREFMQAFHPDREWWVVGGLLRDNLLGKPVKDVDIFINGRSTDLMPEGEPEDGAANAYLLRAHKVEGYAYNGDTYELNLIFMRGSRWNRHTIANRCDFGICQISWCPVENEVYRSLQFQTDVERKTITLCRETAAERVGRMQRKFTDYALQNPDNLQLDGPHCWHYDPDKQAVVQTRRRIQFTA